MQKKQKEHFRIFYESCITLIPKPDPKTKQNQNLLGKRLIKLEYSV